MIIIKVIITIIIIIIIIMIIIENIKRNFWKRLNFKISQKDCSKTATG